MLTVASLRDDRCLTLQKNLRGSAAQKVFAKLSAEGLVKEVLAKAGAPVWRRDEEAGRSYSLKLTAAGLREASAESGSPRQVAATDETPAASNLAEDPVVAPGTIPAVRISVAATPAANDRS